MDRPFWENWSIKSRKKNQRRLWAWIMLSAFFPFFFGALVGSTGNKSRNLWATTCFLHNLLWLINLYEGGRPLWILWGGYWTVIPCVTWSQLAVNLKRHIYTDMNCDTGSAVPGTRSNRGTQCDTTSIMRCRVEQYLLSVDSDYEREWKRQRQHHFYDGCKKVTSGETLMQPDRWWVSYRE